jgi:hypothetical protein
MRFFVIGISRSARVDNSTVAGDMCNRHAN